MQTQCEVPMLTTKSLCAALAALAMSGGVAAAASATTQLNMRSGPGPNYRVINVIPSGASVGVMRCGGGWCRVSFAGRTGFTNAGYLAGGPRAAAVTPVPAASYAYAAAPGAAAPSAATFGNASLENAPAAYGYTLDTARSNANAAARSYAMGAAPGDAYAAAPGYGFGTGPGYAFGAAPGYASGPVPYSPPAGYFGPGYGYPRFTGWNDPVWNAPHQGW